jgi:ABC-2 type transport system ATP-binding protein
MTLAVHIRDLSFEYEANIPVLKDVELQINRGEIFGLLGANGAGKTTLLSFLSGNRKDSNKNIQIFGKSISKFKSIEDWRDIAHAPQELALFPSQSGFDNLRFFASILNLEKEHKEERIRDVLKIVDLTDQQTKLVSNYSGGMKRRLNLAVALLGSPKLLVLDEPTVGVDPQSRNFIFEKIEELREQGMSVIYTTHYMEEIERLCKRIAILHQGEIIYKGDFSEFKKDLDSNSLELGFLNLTGREVRD